MKTITILSLLTLLLLACSDKDNPAAPEIQPVRIAVDQSSYIAGDTIIASLEHDLPDTAWFYLCTVFGSEIWREGEWQPDSDHARTCRTWMFNKIWVAPDSQLTMAIPYESPGKFRLLAEWLPARSDEYYVIYSEPFEVKLCAYGID